VGDGPVIDGIDLAPYLADPQVAPLRDHAVVDKFEPNGFGPYTETGAMVRDARWKLIRRSGQPDALFDLQGLDREGVDLNDGSLEPEETAAFAQLYSWLEAALP
jgi:hypothetical protein